MTFRTEKTIRALLIILLALPVGCAGLAGCASEDDAAPAWAGRDSIEAGETLFTKLPPAYTGLDFANDLTFSEDFNVFTYRNYYNGGGVGLGDVSGDGLPDLYLTANQLPNRLYLNRGGFRFEDVTEVAGVAGRREWSTGVSFADVNGDGRLDLYVSNAGNAAGDDKQNELFINQGTGPDGIPTFSEEAEAYGLADEGYSTHAAFFDYDRDGDLDLYLLNNSFRSVSSFGLKNIRHVRDDKGGDKLFRNDEGQFVDVSEEAGIFGSEIAFGLGVTVGDVDRDGWPDLYVSNDFFERDYLYMNQQDGTFREVLPEAMPHISLSSMGADMADIDGDAYPEIYVTDMLPEEDARQKTTSVFESWNVYQAKLRNDYHHQIMRNALHRNNRDPAGPGQAPTFSEVAPLAGVEATDWSWGALFADLDLDGRNDLFVANGIYKDLTNQDFIDFFANDIRSMARGKAIDEDRKYARLLEKIPSTPIPNYAFRNTGGLSFENATESWGLGTPGFSNGAAYGDLDQDGDLDLVVNNVNMGAFVYRNEADEKLSGNHWLRVRLEGAGKNRLGVGAQVTATAPDGKTFYREQIPQRGFQSSVDPVLLFGLGAVDTLAALRVDWPDGTAQILENVAANQTLTLRQRDARPASDPGNGRADTARAPAPEPLFADVTEEIDLGGYAHAENDFVDFDRERLLPKMLSTEGPPAAVGDVNGDGLDDVFLGGAKEQPGRLLVQQRGGGFASTNEALFEKDKISEDLGAAFFDADGDGDLDLYVASGGNEFSGRAPALKDRLYLNAGGGDFEKASGRLPSRYASSSAGRPADFDGDGDTDLFVGARLVPWRYGVVPESALLENDGTGRFRDVTEEKAPALKTLGLVTDAVWADATGDGRADLVVVGEWMPITILENTGGVLTPLDTPGLEKSHGWWNTIAAEDFDGDGDVDFVAGNLGLNTRLTAKPDAPATLHVGDFDRNGSVDQILALHRDGASRPFLLKDELGRELTFVQKKFTQHADYAGASVEDVLSEEQLAHAEVRRAYTFATSLIENKGGGSFEIRPLPTEAQLAPTYAALPGDFDGDGHTDLLLGGNFHAVKPQIGRMDASYGLFLRGNGAGGFAPVPARESGFRLQGEVRALRLVEDAERGRLVLVVKNDAAPQVFAIGRSLDSQPSARR